MNLLHNIHHSINPSTLSPPLHIYFVTSNTHHDIEVDLSLYISINNAIVTTQKIIIISSIRLEQLANIISNPTILQMAAVNLHLWPPKGHDTNHNGRYATRRM